MRASAGAGAAAASRSMEPLQAPVTSRLSQQAPAPRTRAAPPSGLAPSSQPSQRQHPTAPPPLITSSRCTAVSSTSAQGPRASMQGRAPRNQPAQPAPPPHCPPRASPPAGEPLCPAPERARPRARRLPGRPRRARPLGLGSPPRGPAREGGWAWGRSGAAAASKPRLRAMSAQSQPAAACHAPHRHMRQHHPTIPPPPSTPSP